MCSNESLDETHSVMSLEDTVPRKELEKLEARYEKEKEELRRQIECLLEKVGTVNHIENQININYYGCENVGYISDQFIQEMMKIPYGSIPNIIKHIHFHPAHPENHNVKITNKKLPYASVFKNDKWELAHKKKIVEELMQKGYGIMEDRIDNIEYLSAKGKERYFEFQEKFALEDVDILKRIYQETELCVLNNGNIVNNGN